jgi:hypothetical protein
MTTPVTKTKIVYTEKIRTANAENDVENQQLNETMISCDDQ